MYFIKYCILYFISFIVRPFIRTDPNLLLFSTRGGWGYEGNAKYLFIYGNKYTKYRCVWVYKDKSLFNKINKEGYEAIYYFSIKSLILALKAKAVFITHSLSDVMPIFYNKKTVVINLWHGIPIKNISFLDKNLSTKARILDYWRDKRCDFFISNSLYFNEVYKKCFKINDHKIIVGGLPRMDFLLNPTKFIENIKNPFPKNKSIYLYAPTYRDYKFCNPFFEKNKLKNIEKELEKTNGILYINLHPVDSYCPDLSGYNNIKLLKKHLDVYEILPFVDKLISDYSSIVLDFIIANKTKELFLFCSDLELFDSKRGFLFPFKHLYYNNSIPTNLGFNKLDLKNEEDILKNLYDTKQSSCKTIINLVKQNDKQG